MLIKISIENIVHDTKNNIHAWGSLYNESTCVYHFVFLLFHNMILLLQVHCHDGLMQKIHI